MKSLGDSYAELDGDNTHETFADLIFCALIVLVLFVMALTIEVNQRVRTNRVDVPTVKKIEEKVLSAMTKDEILKLSKKMQRQEAKLKEVQSRIRSQRAKVTDQLAALAGEQRFTGARQPAAMGIAYSIRNRRYYFVPAKGINHADRKQSGESTLEYSYRKITELSVIARATREQRGYTLEELNSIHSAFSRYQEVIPVGDSYRIESNKVGIYYHVLLCGYIAGEVDLSFSDRAEIERAIHVAGSVSGPESNSMYPECHLTVNPKTKRLVLNGIRLSLNDMKAILLSFDGRGAVIDLGGFSGPAPKWLIEKLLTPTGYISKTPKVPR